MIDARELAQHVTIRAVLEALGLRMRSERRADCPRCKGHSVGTISFTPTLCFCHRCHAGGDVFELVKQVRQCDFKSALHFVANIAGVRVHGRRPSRAEIGRQRRDRERLGRAAERLAGEERRLRLGYASECRNLADLARRTALRLRPDADTDAGDAARCERLLAWLPSAQRRAQGAFNVIAFAPVAVRARFALEPAERRAMIEAAVLDGIRAGDGSLVEVTA
jgi:hypothetical protein